MPPGLRPALGLIMTVWTASVAAYDDPWLAHVALTAGHDDNIAHAAVSADRRASGFAELEFGLNRLFAVQRHTALELETSLRSLHYRDYRSWSYSSGGLLARINHRPGGGFFTPTLSWWSSVQYQDHRSELRDGARYLAGISLRQPLTTKLSARGGLHRRWDRADHEVFRKETTTLELDLDWRLTERATAWIGASRRTGDHLSTSRSQAGLREAADIWTPDDAFPDAKVQQLAYRLEGSSQSLALGIEYNSRANLLFGFHLESRRTRTEYASPYRQRLGVLTVRWTLGREGRD